MKYLQQNWQQFINIRILILFSFSLCAMACDNKATSDDLADQAQKPGIEIAASESSVQAALDAPPSQTSSASASVIQVLGLVETRQGSYASWSSLELGAEVNAETWIRTGPESLCELELKDFASISVTENSTVELSALTRSTFRRVQMDLHDGAVFSRISKLAKDDSYQIRTEGAVCGVRGTTFTTKVDKSGTTVVSVEEGKVYLLPPSLHGKALDEKGIDQEVIESLLHAAPVVEAGTVAVVDQQSFADTEKLTETLFTAKTPVTQELLEQLSQSIQDSSSEIRFEEAVLPVRTDKSIEAPIPGDEVSWHVKLGITPLSGGTFPYSRSAKMEAVDPFALAQYETTQEVFEGIMGYNPSQFREDPRLPVDSVNFYEVVEFCNLLSVAEGLSPCYEISERIPKTGWPITYAQVRSIPQADGYRLPTEEEWEYTCRAGSQDPEDWGGTNTWDNVDTNAWYLGNSGSRTHPVGTKKPNDWGFYDMIGNAWEFVWKPLESVPPENIIVRGLAWDMGIDLDYHGAVALAYTDSTHGFRVARSLP